MDFWYMQATPRIVVMPFKRRPEDEIAKRACIAEVNLRELDICLHMCKTSKY